MGGRSSANDTFRADMSLVDVNVAGERDLTWSDWSRPLALSDDGKVLAFGDGGRSNASGKTLGYVRQTDGGAAVQISDTGNPSAYLTRRKVGPAQFALVPPLDADADRRRASTRAGRWTPRGIQRNQQQQAMDA